MIKIICQPATEIIKDKIDSPQEDLLALSIA